MGGAVLRVFPCGTYATKTVSFSTLTNGLILLPVDLLGTVALLIPGLQDIRGMFSS